jgi:hypothetical protein
MKIPKFITRGLVSGALRMRPEVLELMKEFRRGTRTEQPEPPPATRESETTGEVPPAPQEPPRQSQRRLLFVSPSPGRWVRVSCG